MGAKGPARGRDGMDFGAIVANDDHFVANGIWRNVAGKEAVKGNIGVIIARREGGGAAVQGIDRKMKSAEGNVVTGADFSGVVFSHFQAVHQEGLYSLPSVGFKERRLGAVK